MRVLKGYNFAETNEDYEKLWFAAVDYLKSFKFIDSEIYVNRALSDGKSILAEGAQGSMLDIDYGSYPFVTSSNTLASGVCSGIGVAPSKIGKVFGIVKAYCTRVGSGPFPTELFDETGETLCRIGNEYGATTGRKRRCGWLDLVALKYAVMLSGVTDIIITKADVLNDFDKLKVAVAYKVDGQQIDYVPFEMTDAIEPVYVEFDGWKHDISKCKSEADFPKQLTEYLKFIAKETGVTISYLSVGPDRVQTIKVNIN